MDVGWNMSLLERVNEYLRRADRPDDPIGELQNVYSAYNALYAARYPKGRDHESCIRFAMELELSKEQLTALFVNEHTGFFARRFAELGGAVILQITKTGKTKKPPNSDRHKLIVSGFSGDVLTLEHLSVLMDVIYIARCNLIHGGKLVTNPVNWQVCHHTAEILKLMISFALPKTVDV